MESRNNVTITIPESNQAQDNCLGPPYSTVTEIETQRWKAFLYSTSAIVAQMMDGLTINQCRTVLEHVSILLDNGQVVHVGEGKLKRDIKQWIAMKPL